MDDKFKKLREAILQKAPDLQTFKGDKIIFALRDHLYHHALMAPTNDVVDLTNYEEMYLNSYDKEANFQEGEVAMSHERDYISPSVLAEDGTIKEWKGCKSLPTSGGLLCGGLSILYAASLRAFGIPLRLVFLFNTFPTGTPSKSLDLFNSNQHHNHVSVEALGVNEQWIASDVTFNCSFENSRKKLLSYRQMDRTSFHSTSNGYSLKSTWLPCRNIDNYYVSMKELLKFRIILPSISTEKVQIYVAGKGDKDTSRKFIEYARQLAEYGVYKFFRREEESSHE